MTALSYSVIDTSIGPLLLAGSAQGLHRILFADGNGAAASAPAAWSRDDGALWEAAGQLRAYLAGARARFDLPLVLEGTEFQKSVWRRLEAIPRGRTMSYGALAASLGRPNASRAVGAANGRNPLPIVLPCHRVIGTDGSLTGFGGGIALKRRLLELEGVSLGPVLRSDEQPRLL